MRRVNVAPCPNVIRLVESQGLVHTNITTDGYESDEENLYWPDNAYYSFESEEINLLEKASVDVFEMLCEVVDYLVERPDVTEKMAVPSWCLKAIKESWDREPAFGSVYGRFDVCFGGINHPDSRLRVPKFYEFNSDTPTTLIEASTIQWLWLEQTGHGADQFNSITEELVEAWKRNLTEIEAVLGHRPTVHFTCTNDDSSGEEPMTTTLLMETCRQAGWKTKAIYIEKVRLNTSDGRFYDTDGDHINVIFKLYPWEFMVEQHFGEACFADMEKIGLRNAEGEYIGGTIWIEAPYRMLWANKAVWAVMWDMFKDDPRSRWLLPTYFDGEQPETFTKFCRKPIFAREGCDTTLQADGKVIADEKNGWYGREGFVVQELALLPQFKNKDGKTRFPVLGVWMIDGDPAGMGIREDENPITTNSSCFIPHSISDLPVGYEKCPVPELDEIEAALRIDAHHQIKPKTEVLDYIQDAVTGIKLEG